MSSVEIRDVSKSFNGVPAVDNVSLQIQEGEFFGLLGPSGCGKTTLLRMIAGFESPDKGAVLLKNQDVSAVPPNRRPVNMVFQSYALFPHLSVFENIAFGLRQTKTEKADIVQRVNSALELVRLPSLSNRLPRELSGGQQQRVAFARAIVNRPAVLLLDEPLSALDPKVRHEMQAELARFKQELSMTFIMVSHDQSEAFALSHRIAVMSGGKVEQIGTPEDIYNNPATRFVADFIGDSNLLNGNIIATERDHCVVEVTGGTKFYAKSSGDFSPGQKATVWFRNSSVELEASDAPSRGSTGSAFEAEVLHRSFQGDSSKYRLRIPGDQFVNATVRNDAQTHAIGTRIHAFVQTAETHLFTESSAKR